MKNNNKNLTLFIVLFISTFYGFSQTHPINWLKNRNFSIESGTIIHQEKGAASLISEHYLAPNTNGEIIITQMEDLKDFSVSLQSEDKLGNLSSIYSLFFNHIVENPENATNEVLDSIIALHYAKQELVKVSSKDGTKELKSRDFRIFEQGKLVDLSLIHI